MPLMATSISSPAVYVQELGTIPASITAVATAIPAFIGLTKKADKGELTLTNSPTRITSMMEFEMFFWR